MRNVFDNQLDCAAKKVHSGTCTAMENPIEVDYHSSYFMFVPSAQLQKHGVGRNVGKEHA